MTLVRTAPPSSEPPQYVGMPEPLVFPTEGVMPESELHLELRTALYLLLKSISGATATVGSDQFIYYDASDPKKVLAPDVYVHLRPRTSKVQSWKVWERGAPDIAVEIASRSDGTEGDFHEKLVRYQALGVQELVRFDPQAKGPRLRIWNRVDDVLVERLVQDQSAPSLVADLDWTLAPVDDIPEALRIRRNGVLVPTDREAREAEAQARQAEVQAREVETRAREAAEARVRELEALLAARSKSD